MVTIKNVASLAGVSISTVSRVINHSAPVARNKYLAVKKAMETLNYIPNTHARALVGGRTTPSFIGLVAGSNPCSLSAGMFHQIGKVTSLYSKQLVVDCSPCTSIEEQAAIQKMVNDPDLGAFIIANCSLTDMDLVRVLRHCPRAIILDRFVSVLADQCVYADSARTGYRAIEYLHELGHRSFALLGAEEHTFHCKHWFEGCMRAIREKGLFLTGVLKGDATFEGGYQSTLDFLEKMTQTTAFVVYDDVMAAGSMQALRYRNIRIPHDISLLACDDTGIARFLDPAVSTLYIPLEKMAGYAAELAIRRNAVNSPIMKIYESIADFTAEIVYRESVIPPIRVC